ncbi:MAG: reverse transcriptase family protein [Clostridiales bacterium]|jgi:RNA-directed DNA polymerase|nr:reverse transcriptase family protein [Clostridiales bacterium]
MSYESIVVAKLLKTADVSPERIDEIIGGDISREYRVYYIKKSNGGRRVICEPSPDLKKLQRALLPLVKAAKICEPFATAYEEKCSVKSNAERHIKSGHILHMDIKDFFGSVSRELFENAYSDRLGGGDIALVWKLVSLNGGLPIGAPTSPFIANRVMCGIDKRLGKLSLFVKYTRYADDMIFSSRFWLKGSLSGRVAAVVGRAGFKINQKKTYFMSGRREVTGIIITDKRELSVGTAYKKNLKKDIYNLLKKNTGKKDVVRGKFAHLKHIEPGYAEIIKQKYLAIDAIGFFK